MTKHREVAIIRNLDARDVAQQAGNALRVYRHTENEIRVLELKLVELRKAHGDALKRYQGLHDLAAQHGIALVWNLPDELRQEFVGDDDTALIGTGQGKGKHDGREDIKRPHKPEHKGKS